MSVRTQVAGLPSAEAHALVRSMRVESLLQCIDLLRSYAVRADEAIWTGDNFEGGISLWRARATLVEALSLYRLIEPSAAAAIFRNGESKTGEQPLSSPGKHGPPDG
jgi:hypothetical protein